MQYDTMVLWFSIFIFAVVTCQCAAFIAVPPSSSSAASSGATTASRNTVSSMGGNALKDAANIYSLANAQLMMDQVPSGKVSFKPHDLEDVNVRPVYDPGDGKFYWISFH